ncbi:MAG TPA: methyltransferase [Bacteriovoracaceae bacterium]|nr:methyltransferase [Bacteriovoracaceae bacterium]
MNLRQHFLEISEFIRPYQKVWQNEIMLTYPEHFDGYPMEWVDELAAVTDKETIIRIERKEDWSAFRLPSLIEFHRRLEALCALPEAEAPAALPFDSFTFRHMIPKKQHEIKLLAPRVQNFTQRNGIKQIVDIGGGIGLLAQTLSNQYSLSVTSVDMDTALQDTGRNRNRKNAKNPENLVSYQNLKVDGQNSEFLSLLTPETMTLGLHTCGTLAVDQIKSSSYKKIPGIISLGCCYHKMEHNPEAQNISEFAKSNDPLCFSRFALTLASRAHRKLDGKDYDLKTKVKSYRYCIHFLLHDEYGMEGIVPLGNSSPKLYDESFGVYALEQLGRIGIASRHSIEELEAYYWDRDRQTLLWKMTSSGILRNTFGRLLELYILLDRAIFLEEQGYLVKIEEFFDEATSPRNIAISAFRP